MNKKVRNAVRCFLIKDEKVVVIKYKEDNKKAGYYDIPGGKIEDGETMEQTVVREFLEETGMVVSNIKHKGIIHVEYPHMEFIFNTFVTSNYTGCPQNFEENISEWIELNELLKKDKLLSNIIILDRPFIRILTDERLKFKMYMKVDEEENILEVNFKTEKIK
ncbi:MAG: NUDIX domain-containing protein [Clostridia bacterium]|nr:NUDIX domain-containing protein [Clostridia bacterium]MDD4387338.1 NUDIX domain-containing protein [Clostridia bacterium]